MEIKFKADVGMHTPPLNKCRPGQDASCIPLSSTLESIFPTFDRHQHHPRNMTQQKMLNLYPRLSGAKISALIQQVGKGCPSILVCLGLRKSRLLAKTRTFLSKLGQTADLFRDKD